MKNKQIGLSILIVLIIFSAIQLILMYNGINMWLGISQLNEIAVKIILGILVFIALYFAHEGDE